MREVVRVNRRPDLAGEDQAVLLPQLTGRDPCLSLLRPMLPQSGHDFPGERESPARLRASSSSLTTSRVRRFKVLSRFLIRFTPCVTPSVPASQSRADQRSPSTSPRRMP